MPTRIWRTPHARPWLAIALVLSFTGLALAVNGSGQPTQASKSMSLVAFSHHHRGTGGGSTTTTSDDDDIYDDVLRTPLTTNFQYYDHDQHQYYNDHYPVVISCLRSS